MLAIRLQRGGRKGHAQFRVVVQDARRTPSSGRVVAYLGSYNPHTKATALDKEKATFYLDHGAQPSDRVARLLKGEGVKLPDWVKLDTDKERSVRNPEKLRKNQPAAEEAPAEASETEAPADTEAEVAQTPEAEAPAEEKPAKADAA